MATLYVTEYSAIQLIQGRADASIGSEPNKGTQALAISASSNPSVAFDGGTHFVRLHTDANCSVVFGAAPVATAAMMRLAANQTEYFGVVGGQKVAVISNP